jgi:hypothetical protein
MGALNCWEFKKCGREPGGARAAACGVCPAAAESRTGGCNHGTNSGRACWAVAGTLSGAAARGTFAAKFANCPRCAFYQLVSREEGRNFKNNPL